jgi:integrase/recombinase XerD
MTNLVPTNKIDLSLFSSQDELIKRQKDDQWEQSKHLRLGDAVVTWLDTLKGHTRINYESGFKMLYKRGLIDLRINIAEFSVMNHKHILSLISAAPGWSEATQQARAAAFVHFTEFLETATNGIVKKVSIKRKGANKTFFRVREKVKTKALNMMDLALFLAELKRINYRDHLIAKVTLQGGKRISEVLQLEIPDIDWGENIIKFIQLKTGKTKEYTLIKYPTGAMEELRQYLNGRIQGHVFITRNEKPVSQSAFYRQCRKAGERAGIGKKVTPHVLRATFITEHVKRKASYRRIAKASGHKTTRMVAAYDQSDLADNVSADWSII